MKKAILLSVAALIMMPLAAQVRTGEPPGDYLPECKYDSLSNYIDKEKIKAYIGQEFQVLPGSRYSLLGYGYIDRAGNNLPSMMSKVNYDEICGKILRCTNAFKQEKYSTPLYYLELTDQQGQKYIYQHTGIKSEFYFLVLGYQKKFEKTHKDKEYECRISLRLTDFNTGESVVVERGSKLRFEEIIFNTKDDRLDYLYSDDNGHVVGFRESSLEDLKELDGKLSPLEEIKARNTTILDRVAYIKAILPDTWMVDVGTDAVVKMELYDICKKMNYSLSLVRGMTFTWEKDKERKDIYNFKYADYGEPFASFTGVTGYLKPGTKLVPGKKYKIVGGETLDHLPLDQIGFTDEERTIVCCGFFVAKDIEVEPAE